MIPLIVGAATAIGSALAASAQNQANANADRAQQNANVDKTIAANRYLAQLQFDQNKQMWAANNEYNSPQEQMARLRAAGLNPNLVYGSNAVANTSGGIPEYVAPKESYDYKAPQIFGQFPAVLGAYQDFILKQAQTDNVQASTEAIRTRTANDQIQNSYLGDTFWHRVQLTKDKMNLQRIDRDIKRDTAWKISDYNLDALRLSNKRQQMTLDKIGADTLFRKYQNEWMKHGITTSDNPILRMLSRLIGAKGEEVANWFKRQDPGLMGHGQFKP